MSAKSRRILALLKDPRHRERLVQTMNRENMDEVGAFSGNQSMATLMEMNDLDSDRKPRQVMRGSLTSQGDRI